MISKTNYLRIMVSAGEVSGDQRAAELVRELKVRYPKIELFGMGGAQLEAEGMKLLVDSQKSGGVMGFTEVLSKFLVLKRSLDLLGYYLNYLQPQILILIDFPDFNLRLASKAKKLGIPVLYYVPPKIWAWRRRRINKIKANVDCVACIFPFEPEFYRKNGYKSCFFVGHPFSENLLTAEVAKQQERIPPNTILNNEKKVAVFPGSRSAELSKNLPVINETLELLNQKKLNLKAIFAAPNEVFAETIKKELPQNKVKFKYSVVIGTPLAVLASADAGLLKSGTCNLEAAFLKLPFLVFYKVAPLTAFIVKGLVKLKNYSIVNIIEANTVSEFMQRDAEPQVIAEHLEKLLIDSELREKQLKKLEVVVKKLSFTPDSQHKFLGSTCASRVVELIDSLINPASRQ
jgi:lipid-A-disaccharide synthase